MEEKELSPLEKCIQEKFGSLENLFNAILLDEKKAIDCLWIYLYKETFTKLEFWFKKNKKECLIHFATDIFIESFFDFLKAIQSKKFKLRGQTEEEKQKGIFGWFINKTLKWKYKKYIKKLNNNRKKLTAYQQEIRKKITNEQQELLENLEIRIHIMNLMRDMGKPCSEILISKYYRYPNAGQPWTRILNWLNLNYTNHGFQTNNDIQTKFFACLKKLYESYEWDELFKMTPEEVIILTFKSMNKLDKITKEVIMSSAVEGFSMKEIANNLGFFNNKGEPNDDLVKQRKSRGIKKLYDILIKLVLGI